MNVTFFNNQLSQIKDAIEQLRILEKEFLKNFGLKDIVSNSKIYEIVIADVLGHTILPKLSNTKDAIDQDGKYIEYKHFKESSSNHSWTFNDFSDTTIKSLNNVKFVIFSHFQDFSNPLFFDWYYEVPGPVISKYLEVETLKIKNKRKMINISPKQIETKLNYSKIFTNTETTGNYRSLINRYIDIVTRIEKLCDTTGILTSNKLWELILGIELNHKVNSEQGGRDGAHDAEDMEGNTYEYKISKTGSWNFQDISENVLIKYLNDKEIITAIADKENFIILHAYSIKPELLVPYLRDKLNSKKEKKGQNLRRLQVTISKNELIKIGAKKII